MANFEGFPLEEFLAVPFTHHIRILERVKDCDARLFYNRELGSLVAVELKRGPFKTAYLGQLNSYLTVLDDYVRKPNENPSIGLILCKSADKAIVEYLIKDYNKPMGVATFRTKEDMPEKFRKALPDIKELKKLL